jgi:cytochrome c oxidase subunit 2
VANLGAVSQLSSRRWAAARSAAVRPRNRRARTGRLSGGLVVLATALLLSGCNSWPAFGESPGLDAQGRDIAKLYSGMFVAGLIVAVLVWGLIGWCVVSYRKKGRDFIPRQFQEHIPLEITYTIIPLVIVIVIFVFTVITENTVDAVSKRPAVTVNVRGYQWGWNFRYENAHGLTLRTQGAVRYLPANKGYTSSVYPQLVLPEGEATKIVLRSDDVIHEFYVQAFDFGRYAQPGHRNVFEFTPTKTGVYPAQCSEYCGLYHSEMLFSVRVIPAKQFRSWLSYYQAHQNQIPKHYPLTQQ